MTSPDDTRSRILDALADHPDPGGATMTALAKTAGVSRVTLHRVFGGRAALLDALRQERGVDATEPPDTRDRILHAAREVFLERGLHTPTVEDVAERAGVGPATVYRHFGTRQGLIAAFGEAVSVRRAIRTLPASAPADLESALARFCTEALRAAHATRGLLPLMLQGHAEDPELLASLRRGQGGVRQRLGALFAQAAAEGKIDPDLDPLDLTVGVMGLVTGYAVFGPGLGLFEFDDPERLGRLIARMVLHGVAR